MFDPHRATARDLAVGAGLHVVCAASGVALALLLHAAGTARWVQAVWSFAGPLLFAGVLVAATAALRRRRA